MLSLTQVPDGRADFVAYGTVTRYGAAFQRLLLKLALVTPAIEGSPVLLPRRDKSRRFGLIPVRSPLLRESLLLSFPGGTEMFQFPPFATYTYGFSVR